MDMKSYMNQMDKELADTDVGQSFERLPPKAKVEEVKYDYLLVKVMNVLYLSYQRKLLDLIIN